MSGRPFEAANAEASRALLELAGSLSPADLAVDLGDGWTVAMALAHLAFWDGFHLARWSHAASAGLVAPPHEDEEVTARANEALAATWRALPPSAAVGLCLDAAAAMDACAGGLTEEQVAAARADHGDHWVERSPHRMDHVRQIRTALGRT